MRVNDIEKNLKRIIDNSMRLRRRSEPIDLSKLENFLSEFFVHPDIKEDFRKDPDELERLKAQNLLINWALAYIDAHPCSEIHYIAEPVRATIWKHAGVKCDNLSKVHIAKGVRFFNPSNIVIVTGGYDVSFAGLRSPTFLDGRSKLIIFGPATFGAGVKIFTHEHMVSDPLLHWEKGRVLIPCIIYPDCFIGDDVHIFGIIDAKTVLADMSIKRPAIMIPPYSIVGGIGKTFKVIRYIDFPRPFPPEYLIKVQENVKKSFPKLGMLLTKYYEVIKELSDMSGDRAKNWEKLRRKINAIEREVLQESNL
jgi:acetyltransferase-like isoleucine patch superfamily enzyme